MNSVLIQLKLYNQRISPLTDGRAVRAIRRSTFNRFFHPFLFVRHPTSMTISRSAFTKFLDNAIAYATEKQKYARLTFDSQKSFFGVNELNIKQCLFKECITMKKRGGGGVLLERPDGKITINKSLFTDCHAASSSGSGGAVSIVDGTAKLSITECCFKDCSATLTGQAIHVIGTNITGIIGDVQADNCPSVSALLQACCLSLKSTVSIGILNISNTRTAFCPAFRIKATPTISIKYLLVDSCSVKRADCIAEIGSIDQNGLISCDTLAFVNSTGMISKILLFEYNRLIVENLVLHENHGIRLIRFISTGTIEVRNCFSGVLPIANSNMSGSIIVDKLYTGKESRMAFYSKAHYKGCYLTMDTSLSAGSSMLMVFISLFVCGFVVVVTVGFLSYYISNRRSRLYENLAVPRAREMPL